MIQPLSNKGTLGRDVEVNGFIEITGGWVELSSRDELQGFITGLFNQFPFSRIDGVFTRFEFTGREFREHRLKGVPELIDHQPVAVFIAGSHTNPAGMTHHFTHRGIPVG